MVGAIVVAATEATMMQLLLTHVVITKATEAEASKTISTEAVEVATREVVNQSQTTAAEAVSKAIKARTWCLIRRLASMSTTLPSSGACADPMRLIANSKTGR